MEYIFGGEIPVKGVTLKDMPHSEVSPGDVVLLSSCAIGGIVTRFLPAACEAIVSGRTINIVRLEQVISMEKASRFLVVNDTPGTTAETVADLKNVLPEHDFLPYMAHQPIPD